MPIIHCPECQKEMSDRMVKCPKCGHSMTTSGDAPPTAESLHLVPDQPQKKGVVVFVLLVIAVLSIGTYFATFHGQKTIFENFEFVVNAGQSRSFDFVLGKKVKIKEIINVESGPVVDLYLMTEPQYEVYREMMEKPLGGEFIYEKELNGMGVRSATLVADLSPNRYYVVVKSGDHMKLFDGTHASNVKLSLTAKW